MEDSNVGIVQDELEALKDRAKLIGLKYHPNIKADALREKINAHLAGQNTSTGEVTEPEELKQVVTKVDPKQSILDKRKEATRLVRIRLTCMNPAKKEWDGEIITVGNSLVGTLKKFIPFNADEGWHVPQMMLNFLRERECQIFTTTKDSKGNNIRKGKLIKEFAIEVLPPLTQEELAELARRQAARKSVD